ncbi:hypothetical protein AB0P21_30695 [Kribbella sp. NPDC056861]|uniref:hypothetical protein n=1 Tax=Kribbella sp. NPDC056861 TaxID=3154857 RepID=UPI00341299B6
MDYQEDFESAVRDAVASCVKRNRQTRDWKDDQGNSATGWSVEQESWGPNIEGNPGGGWWRERWGNREFILAVDGKIWYSQFNGEDSSASPSYQGTRMELVPESWLVGNKGKPYSEWKAKIERMPYR